MEGFCLRISDGTAYAAADNGNFLEAVIFCGNTQRTYKVADGVANFFGCQQFCGQTNFLEDDGDGAFFSVIISDGQRDTFAEFIYAENNKLPRFGFFCHKRGFDFKQCHSTV